MPLSAPLPTPAEIFARPGQRHTQRIHTATVVAVEQLSPSMVRVTFGPDDLDDLASTGPADHLRVFFPDPDAPSDASAGRDLHRDFTPLPQDDPSAPLALDFALHPDPGPASVWASRARPGLTLEVAGPRGSRGIPAGADHLVLVGDETALPSISRWIAESSPEVKITVIALLRDPADRTYLAPTERVELIEPTDGSTVATPLTSDLITSHTFVFAAGEASWMKQVRRHLRADLGLARDQFVISGYWRQGAGGYDHHTPLDDEEAQDRTGRL